MIKRVDIYPRKIFIGTFRFLGDVTSDPGNPKKAISSRAKKWALSPRHFFQDKYRKIIERIQI